MCPQETIRVRAAGAPRVPRGSETESADLSMFLVGLFGTRSKADLNSNDLVEGKPPGI